jgi:pyruvate formate lyase activating enzyme
MGAISPVRIEAKYYRREGDKYVCELCPHHCHIGIGQYGRCGARRGNEDFLEAYSYGRVSSLCVDPIEKKPLNNYFPGSRIFSVGGIGCNMTCKHCQNYAISQSETGKKRTTFLSPQELVDMCHNEKLDSIAFTYNEPMIWYEYIMDVAKCDPSLRIVLVTNGLADEKPLRDLCKITDAMNIDVKGFTDDFYMQVCGAHLNDVLAATKISFEEGVHVELTYLIIPGYNDSKDEIRKFAEWVRTELSCDVPVHFTRFHPDNNMETVPWTPLDTMTAAADIASEAGLNYVYLGNVLTEGGSDTYCPECGATVIKRTGYLVDVCGLDGNRCISCHHKLNIITDNVR